MHADDGSHLSLTQTPEVVLKVLPIRDPSNADSMLVGRCTSLEDCCHRFQYHFQTVDTYVYTLWYNICKFF